MITVQSVCKYIPRYESLFKVQKSTIYKPILNSVILLQANKFIPIYSTTICQIKMRLQSVPRNRVFTCLPLAEGAFQAIWPHILFVPRAVGHLDIH